MLNGILPKAKPLSRVANIFLSADISLANLEVPLTKCRQHTLRKTSAELKHRDQFILKGDPAHIPFLAEEGLKAVSLANNHTMDYGSGGLEEETVALEKNGIYRAGAGRNSAAALSGCTLTSTGGQKIALLSCLAFVGTKALRKTTPATSNSAGVNVMNFNGVIDEKARARLARWITGARFQADLVVVAVHWGIERKTIPTAYQVSLGRAMIDAGADMVWGHHPHVLQGAEWYEGKPILYSMGNLISATSAQSGLCQFAWSQGKFRTCKFFPISIRGGKTMLTTVKESIFAVKSFQALCRNLLLRYPNQRSVPLL